MHPTFYFVLAALLAASAYAQVVDIDGEILFMDDSFYVLPVIRGQGGGLTLRGRGGKPCPFDIVQSSSEVNEGIPVKFSGWTSRVGFVPDSENLHIKTVVKATICLQSTYWRIGEFDDVRKQYFVVAGPKPKSSEKDSLKSFFTIEKSGDDAFKFVFCPRDWDSDSPKCSDVGIFVDELGVRRLALSDTPFLVMFKKANVTEV
ncbi:Kunitz trypsin inhibitor 4 [Cardamine amara subsp. amara]|uniref:Kunitz trypsin inhibitor 4 n=1 Tax=Cardamine amara subsp. amara TaxID=228776 RepID=A0ABD0ZCM4_CARAN